MKKTQEIVIDRIPVIAHNNYKDAVIDTLEKNGYNYIVELFDDETNRNCLIKIWIKNEVCFSRTKILNKRKKDMVDGCLLITNKDVVKLSSFEMKMLQARHPKLFRKSKIKNFLSEE